MIVVGYRLWWIRRPAGAAVNPAATLLSCWLSLSRAGRFSTLVIALLLGLMLPVMGGSLLLFILIDALRWKRAVQRSASVQA